MTWLDFRLRRIARSTKPILVGPFRSELGFECLYWLPLLAKWRQQYRIPKERLVVLSRGGAGIWYDAGRTAELYDYAPVSTIRKAMLRDSAASGSIKQAGMSEWERVLLPVIAQDLGLSSYHLLHPSLMYTSLAPWWEGRVGQATALAGLRWGGLPVPAPPLSLPLPERFVAVRFYSRLTWPLSEELRTWVWSAVEGMSKLLPIVVLDSGLHADDHMDFPIPLSASVTSIRDHVTPQNNLAVQSAVIAKAQAFVGTYGTAIGHKQLTEWIAMQQGTPCFIGRPDDARFVKEAMSW
jgi:hypothetical protein